MRARLIQTAAIVTSFVSLTVSGSAQVAAFQGAPGEPGAVWLLDSVGSAAPTIVSGLDGIRLLPIECAGRTAINSFANNRARLYEDVPGASRLALPGGGGSLYAYQRTTSAGEFYGYFVITAAGHVRRLIEFLTSSPGQSPFLDRVAISPDGAHALLGTRSFAGGDLYEVAIANGLVTARTANLPPQYFEGGGIALLDNWGAAVGSAGLIRFDRAPGAQAQPVSIGNATPDSVGRELVATFNGQYCAAFAFDESGGAYPVVFSRTGAARRVGSGAYPTVGGVGLAPDALHGPWLTVSEDGQWCAWRTTNGHYYGYEAWLAPVPWTSPTSASLDVTQPALFDDYIDEIGDFFFNSAGRFILAAGDRSFLVNGLDKSDLYAVTLPAPSSIAAGALPLVENLTATSGQTTAPFLYYGELVVERAFATPDGQSLYVIAKDEQESGEPVERSMFAIESTNPTPLVLEDDFTTLDYFDVASDELILSATYVDEPEDNGLSRVQAGVSTALEELHEFGIARDFRRGLSRADGQTIYVLADANGEQLWRTSAGQPPIRMTPRYFQYGPALAFTPTGDAACTIHIGPSPIYVAWQKNGVIRRMKGPAGSGFLLPGA